MSTHPDLPDALLRARSVVLLPAEDRSRLIPGIEVLIQEGFSYLSLPVTGLDHLDLLRSVFGSRATFAVHDLTSAEQIESVCASQVDFVTTITLDDDLLSGLHERGIAVAAPALTPTEVNAVWRREEVAAVSVAPASILGTHYAAALSPLCPGARLIPRGVNHPYEARAWITAGAVAVCLDAGFTGSMASPHDLDDLRRRAQAVKADLG